MSLATPQQIDILWPSGQTWPTLYSYFFLIMVIVEDDVRLIAAVSPFGGSETLFMVYVSNDVRPKYLEVSVKGKMAPPMLKQRKPEIWSTHHYKKYR